MSRDSDAGKLLTRVSELVKRALWRVSSRLFRKAVGPFSGQRYSIGIYMGNSPLGMRDPCCVGNPVLTRSDVTDVPATFVADPFMIRRDGRWYMYFEVMNRTTLRGQISLAVSEDGKSWNYQHTVLQEPFHLAYPYVFECEGEVYMVPDSPGHGVRLYRAAGFPAGWELVTEIFSDNYYSDPTIIPHGGRWWMFVAWSPSQGEAKSLRLFHADHPMGAWREHPSSPLVTRDDRIARPAGRVQFQSGRLLRLAQDCSTSYGLCVYAFEIVELSPEVYRERPLAETSVLERDGSGWNADGMHHADVHRLEDGRWIACVDGWYSERHEANR